MLISPEILDSPNQSARAQFRHSHSRNRASKVAGFFENFLSPLSKEGAGPGIPLILAERVNNVGREMDPLPSADDVASGVFWQQTNWSTVSKALAAGPKESQKALDDLYRQYERPIRMTIASYLRKWSWVEVDLEDAVQDFLQKSFHVEELHKAWEAHERGTQDGKKLKLREFFSSRLHQFAVTSFVRHWGAEVRNPRNLVRFEDLPPEVRVSLEPLDLKTGEWEFDRQHAIRLIQDAYDGLESALEMEGKKEQFKMVMSWILDLEVVEYAEIAASLEIEEKQLSARVNKLKLRFRNALWFTVKETLYNPTDEEVDMEVKEIIRLFGTLR